MFKTTVVVIVSLLICGEISGGLNETDVVPVLIWGPKLNKQPSALQKLSAEELHAILDLPSRSHLVVVFLEKQLNIRDFSLYKSKTTAYPAPYMASRENKTFFNSVINPAKLFKAQIANAANETKQKKSIRRLYAKNCSIGRKHIFTFNDVIDGHNKTKIIENHDRIIADVSQSLENCSVMYIYTAHSATPNCCCRQKSKRFRRSPQDDDFSDMMYQNNPPSVVTYDNSTYFEIYEGNIKLRWKQFIHVYGSRQIALTFDYFEVRTDPTNTIIMLGNDKYLAQVFTSIESNGHYVMKFILLDDKNYWLQDVTAPLYASYKCKKLYAVSDIRNTIIWQDVQFQLFDKMLNGTTKKTFSPAWNCVGFVTIPILSGIFIMILIIGIVAIGITWIMDINNMDRFDDAKGKHIFIPSS